MRVPFRNGTLVLVKWVDSSGIGLWTDLDAAKENPLIVCETVGRLLNRSDGVVRIVGSVGSNNTALHVISIPRVCILSMVRLVEE